MIDEVLNLERFVARGIGAQAAVDHAIARADLLARVSRLRRELVRVRLKRDDDVTDAQLRLGVAELALAEFDQVPR